jgi:hypothetical protein
MDIHNQAEKEPNQLIIRGTGSNMKRRPAGAAI